MSRWSWKFLNVQMELEVFKHPDGAGLNVQMELEVFKHPDEMELEVGQVVPFM